MHPSHAAVWIEVWREKEITYSVMIDCVVVCVVSGLYYSVQSHQCYNKIINQSH